MNASVWAQLLELFRILTLQTFGRGQGEGFRRRRAGLEPLPFASEVCVIWRNVLDGADGLALFAQISEMTYIACSQIKFFDLVFIIISFVLWLSACWINLLADEL